MSYSGDELIKMGQKASFLYFTDDVPLEESISKIASNNNLNPEQVKRVCESANKSTMIQIFKSDSDNCCTFKVASAKSIISKLSKYDDPVGKISDDYCSAPPCCIMSDVKLAELCDYSDSPDIDICKLRGENAILTKQAQILEAELVQATDNSFCGHVKYAGSWDVLYDILKRNIMKGVHSFQDFFEVARAAIPGALDTVKSVFSGIKEKMRLDPAIPRNALQDMLSGSALFKSASPVEDKYISKALGSLNGKVPMRIINGAHPVIVQLKVIIDAKKNIRDSDMLAGEIRNKLSVVTKKLEDVNKKGDWH